MRSRRLRAVLETCAFSAVAFFARASFADHYKVPSGSMEPTVQVGDHVAVAKAAYGMRVPMTDLWLARWADPARGDVVVLDSPEDAKVLLKRVVAVAGDRVEVRDGRVRIDGREIAEPWASLAMGGGPDFGPVDVPSGKLLVLGDNRGNSHDGRELGWIDERAVLGHALAVVSRDGHLGWDPL